MTLTLQGKAAVIARNLTANLSAVEAGFWRDDLLGSLVRCPLGEAVCKGILLPYLILYEVLNMFLTQRWEPIAVLRCSVRRWIFGNLVWEVR